MSWRFLGTEAGATALVVTLPLALYTRYYYERRSSALHDARTFFVLGSRKRFKQRLADEGERLAAQIEKIAEELGPRVAAS